MKLVTILLASSLLAALTCCRSTEPTTPAGDQADAPSIEQPAELAAMGDVEPLSVRDRDYDERLHAIIGDPRGADVWMTANPYWSQGYSIALRAPTAAGEKWTMTVVVAEKPMQRERAYKPVQAGTWTVELNATQAAVIASATRAVVRRARYPKPVIRRDSNGNTVETTTHTTDGATFEYHAGRFFGTTYSPGPGLGRDLETLALRLRDIALAPVAQREALVAECVMFARTLRERAEAAPW